MGKIVVGIDGSWASKEILRFALEEARLRGSTLLVVHAWRHPAGGLQTHAAGDPVQRTGERPKTRAEKEQERLERFVDKLVPAADVEITASAVEGSPAPILVEAAEGAELLVVGSRGQGGFTGLLLGSVSQQVVHHAQCPVVIVRPHGRPHRLMWPEV